MILIQPFRSTPELPRKRWNMPICQYFHHAFLVVQWIHFDLLDKQYFTHIKPQGVNIIATADYSLIVKSSVYRIVVAIEALRNPFYCVNMLMISSCCSSHWLQSNRQYKALCCILGHHSHWYFYLAPPFIYLVIHLSSIPLVSRFPLLMSFSRLSSHP